MLSQKSRLIRAIESSRPGGLVFKAKDPRLERFVTIKVLPPELTRDDQAKQRFVQEALILRSPAGAWNHLATGSLRLQLAAVS